TTAYETWIDGLHEVLQASIRHISIDEFVDIDWIHDGPMPERPQERRKRLELEYLMDIERNYGLEEQCEWNFDCDDYMGDWKVRWTQRKSGNHDSCEETVSDVLDVMEERIAKVNTPMGGFGKDGIRKLVASYPASQFDPSACAEYDGEYGEDFGAEYGEEYDEGSEEHGQEDLEEGHEREHEKEITRTTTFVASFNLRLDLCAITYHFLVYVVLERVDPTMSSPGAWKSPINPNAAFEPAGEYTLWQKDVPAWRDYNRQLTEAYETVLMERDAFKRQNISLQRDVREFESALDASGRPATVGPSEDLRSAHSKHSMAHFNKKLSHQELEAFDPCEEARRSFSSRVTLDTDPTENVQVNTGCPDPEKPNPMAGDKRAADSLPCGNRPLQKRTRTEQEGEGLPEDQNSSAKSQTQEPTSSAEQNDQQAQQAETEELPTTQRSPNGSEPETPTPKFLFFSLPPELRDKIYGYLVPNRIHTAPPLELQRPYWASPCYEEGDIRNWGLIFVSRQFRLEIRQIAYSPTPIDIHLSDNESITAYKTWAKGLPTGVLLRHIGIDEIADIDWMPDGC
ncbi:MAG: hypothetical protein Q9192_008163, partial [Flavoplaca navasiana]